MALAWVFALGALCLQMSYAAHLSPVADTWGYFRSWSAWGMWSTCSVTCGQGTQYRTRVCNYNGQPYNGQPYNGQPYNGQPYNGQPYNGQPYNGQPYTGQPYDPSGVWVNSPSYPWAMDSSKAPWLSNPNAPWPRHYVGPQNVRPLAVNPYPVVAYPAAPYYEDCAGDDKQVQACRMADCVQMCTYQKTEKYQEQCGYTWAPYTCERFRTTTETCPCPDPYDVVAVVDGSSSLTDRDFLEMKTSMKDFVGRMKCGDYFGLVLYSDAVQRVVALSGDTVTLQTALDNLQHPRGPSTYTNLGLEKMIEMMSASTRHAKKVAVVLTDGQSTNRAATLMAANKAKVMGIQVCVIKVGSSANQYELDSISSPECSGKVTSYVYLRQQHYLTTMVHG